MNMLTCRVETRSLEPALQCLWGFGEEEGRPNCSLGQTWLSARTSPTVFSELQPVQSERRLGVRFLPGRGLQVWPWPTWGRMKNGQPASRGQSEDLFGLHICKSGLIGKSRFAFFPRENNWVALNPAGLGLWVNDCMGHHCLTASIIIPPDPGPSGCYRTCLGPCRTRVCCRETSSSMSLSERGGWMRGKAGRCSVGWKWKV